MRHYFVQKKTQCARDPKKRRSTPKWARVCRGCPAGTHGCAAETLTTLQAERHLVHACIGSSPHCCCHECSATDRCWCLFTNSISSSRRPSAAAVVPNETSIGRHHWKSKDLCSEAAKVGNKKKLGKRKKQRNTKPGKLRIFTNRGSVL